MAEKDDDTPSSTSDALSVRPARFFVGDVMRITVTYKNESKTYTIHQNVLCQISRYFAALPNFHEGQENHVTLNDVSHDTFENVVHWMYKDDFDPLLKHQRTVMISTWVAADRLMMTRCKNMVLDALRQTSVNHYVRPKHLETVYRLGYTADSPLAQYLSDQLAYDYLDSSLDTKIDHSEQFEDVPISSVVDLMLKVVATSRTLREPTGKPDLVDPAKMKGCHYHEHPEGEQCYLDEAE